MSEVQSRCPTCNDSFALPVGMHPGAVECPSCRQKAAGATLLDAEDDDQRTIFMLAPPPHTDEGGPPAEKPADEARTHLMLQNPRPPRASNVADDERTHLLLNADDLKDDAEPEPPAPPAALPASDPWTSNAHALHLEGPKPENPDDARTHLLLDAADLKELAPRALDRVHARLGGLAPHALGFGRRVDQLLGGEWTAALGGLALAASVVAPLGAALSDGVGTVLHRLIAVSALLGFTLYGFAWFGRLSAEDGEWGPGVPGLRFRSAVRLLLEDLGEFGRSPAYLKLLSVAQVLALAGLAGLALASLRTCTRWLFAVPDASGALAALSGLLVLLGLGLRNSSAKATPRPPLRAEDQSECVAAAAELPPIIDLSEPLPASFIGGHTPLHRVLVALSQWGAEHWPDEAAYRARLERYLQRNLLGSRIERDQALGGSREDGRVDLVVDDLVSILVKRRFQKTSAALAVTTLTRQALARPGKPMLLVVFDAPREAVFETGSLKTLIDLHQRLPVVTARMPVRLA